MVFGAMIPGFFEEKEVGIANEQVPPEKSLAVRAAH
jgi:hypothetical protein